MPFGNYPIQFYLVLNDSIFNLIFSLSLPLRLSVRLVEFE